MPDPEVDPTVEIVEEPRIDRTILPEDEEKEHLEFVDKQVLSHPVVKEHHAKWKELIEWENGDQFSEWDTSENKMVAVRLNRRKKRVVINLMKPLAEAIEGKINFISMFQGMPNSSEREDITASEVATKFVAHNDYVNDVEALNEDLKYDLIRTGNAVRKWTWELGSFGWVKKEGDKKAARAEGELIGSVPSIFNIRPDPTAKNIEGCRWFIEIMEVTQDEILEKFSDLTEDDLKIAMEHTNPSDKYKGMYEPEKEKDRDEKTFITRYYWERSCPKYKNGRLIISIPNLVLWAKENPALGEIPYFKYGYKRYGNSFWCTGPLHHVQGIQREFNRTESIISEHVEGWRAKMVLEEGAVIKDGAFTMDSFEILQVNPGRLNDIKPLTMPELSPQVMNHRDFLLAAKDLVSNVHEVSYSQLPQYATRAPASLYAMMMEQENLKIDPMVKQINKTLKKEAKFRLRMMGEYYDAPRQIKIVGRNERSTIAYFRGADLKGNYDVKLVIGVSIHQSKAIQQRMILEMKQQGAPIEWNLIFKLLWEGDISEDLRSDIIDNQRAARENQAFNDGKYKGDFKNGGVTVLYFDDHELHVKMHGDLSKTEEAQGWDDETWKAFASHVSTHVHFIEMKVQAAMAQGIDPNTGQLIGNRPKSAATTPGGGAGAETSPGATETQQAEQNLPF
jgi:hypothetical protein